VTLIMTAAATISSHAGVVKDTGWAWMTVVGMSGTCFL